MQKEVYTAFYCRNRTAMEESFTTSDDIEQSKIEEIAGIPNADKNMTVCCCRGMCTRGKVYIVVYVGHFKAKSCEQYHLFT